MTPIQTVDSVSGTLNDFGWSQQRYDTRLSPSALPQAVTINSGTSLVTHSSVSKKLTTWSQTGINVCGGSENSDHIEVSDLTCKVGGRDLGSKGASVDDVGIIKSSDKLPHVTFEGDNNLGAD